MRNVIILAIIFILLLIVNSLTAQEGATVIESRVGKWDVSYIKGLPERERTKMRKDWNYLVEKTQLPRHMIFNRIYNCDHWNFHELKKRYYCKICNPRYLKKDKPKPLN